ncbi:hypothetical protein [Butyrivibrio sp. FC2001]|uniref:hypothetical protein n=1 Tax=Butyrivibrio sp. FC2001 TaxID=1280671 RepID=UPI00040743A1|nr:hypothetical protein [Butyrivibrio sp. FC2001]
MSENRMFILKQKNHDVAVLQLSLEGDIENYEIINPARMPYLGSTEKKHLYSWWKDRAIPEGRERLVDILKEYDCESPQELLMKNLGLSLNDTYWISPAELDLTWEEVNLFDNGDETIDFHDGQGRVHYSNSKDAALGGHLEKHSVKIDGVWYLDKYSDPKYPGGLLNVNELFASLVHEKQGFKEFVRYELLNEGDELNKLCRCRYFTDAGHEFVSAFEVSGGFRNKNEYNGELELEHFIRTCTEFGLKREYVCNFIDYMILTDFAISNSDRHWNNFGIIRDSETLEFISLAPIYDNGNSMFFDAYNVLNRPTILRVEDSGIMKRETDRLKVVNDRSLIKIELLPEPEEVRDFYIEHAINRAKADIIMESYKNKIDLFMEYQNGLPIGYNIEMFEYGVEVPVKNRKINANFFKDRPDLLTDEIKRKMNK